MPSRWQALLIMAFWLSSVAWLYVREIEPEIRSNEPPPYAIDLTAEAQLDDNRLPRVTWKVFNKDGNKAEEIYLYQANTWVDHRDSDDTFALHLIMRPAPLLEDIYRDRLVIRELKSTYRITREGRLRGLDADAEIGKGIFIPISLRGDVQAGKITATISSPGIFEFKLDPVPVADNGSVMLLLHPVNRIRGVRPGQTWSVPLINPLADAAAAKFGDMGIGPNLKKVPVLHARVLPEQQMFEYDKTERACWVIEYQGEEEQTAETWVEVGTGLVLCQKAMQGGVSWRMERDTASSRVR